jgi:hypothetical protein
MLNDKKEKIKQEMAEVLNRHRIEYDVSNDREFNIFVERILVENANDP